MITDHGKKSGIGLTLRSRFRREWEKKNVNVYGVWSINQGVQVLEEK